MPLAAQILALVAAALHVLFFYLESVVFSKPSTWKGFGVASQEAADHIKPMALNQGFYNLFLAIGVIVGFIKIQTSGTEQFMNSPHGSVMSGDLGGLSVGMRHVESWGPPVIIFALACMTAAALVLIISSRGKLLRAALIQGVAPTAALIIAAVA